MSEKKLLHTLGNIVSVFIGWAIWLKYGWQLGMLTFYIVGVLVDIRKEVTND